MINKVIAKPKNNLDLGGLDTEFNDWDVVNHSNSDSDDSFAENNYNNNPHNIAQSLNDNNLTNIF